jgi:hypothetical protein
MRKEESWWAMPGATHRSPKKRGGIKFSGAKALRRNALRKRDASGSCEDDRIVDEVDKNDEDEP